MVLAVCASPTPARHLDVLAASSLTDSFPVLARRFEAETGIEVRLVFGGSPSLVRQVGDGAEADVIATADVESLGPIRDRIAQTETFARNRLVIVTEVGNPTQVRGLADLGRVTTVLCAPSVPCGRLAAAALARAGVAVTPASLELNVKAVLAKVELGEADAGVVYVTDAVAAATKVHRVDLPPALSADRSLQPLYPAAVLKGDRTGLARRWVRFLLSPSSQRTMRSLGFSAP